MGERGPKPEAFDPDAIERWQTLRAAAKRQSKKRSKEDLKGLTNLEKISWLSEICGHEEALDSAVRSAREAGDTWVAIATALGEKRDTKTVNKIRNRFTKRLS